MERKAIGFKAETGMGTVIGMILGGLALIIGGIIFFVFVIQGAIGGTVAGGMAGGGGSLIFSGISLMKLPNELVFVDDNAVYLPKNVIPLNSINSMNVKGKAIIFMLNTGKRVMQGYLANAQECYEQLDGILKNQGTTAA